MTSVYSSSTILSAFFRSSSLSIWAAAKAFILMSSNFYFVLASVILPIIDMRSLSSFWALFTYFLIGSESILIILFAGFTSKLKLFITFLSLDLSSSVSPSSPTFVARKLRIGFSNVSPVGETSFNFEVVLYAKSVLGEVTFFPKVASFFFAKSRLNSTKFYCFSMASSSLLISF